jgi:hypothetical protein
MAEGAAAAVIAQVLDRLGDQVRTAALQMNSQAGSAAVEAADNAYSLDVHDDVEVGDSAAAEKLRSV